MGAQVLSEVPQHAVDERSDCLLIRLSGVLCANGVSGFEEDVHDRILRRPTHVVLDFSNVEGISSFHWTHSICFLKKQIEGTGFKLRIASANAPVIAFLKDQGVDGMLAPSASIAAALTELGLRRKATLDTKFVNPFLDATMRVIRIQVGTESRPGQIFVKGPGEPFLGDVSGVIAIESETFTGSVVVSFPEDAFINLMSKMLGEPVTAVTGEITDGAAELVNMIFGQAKVTLNSCGFGIKTAIPSIVVGRKMPGGARLSKATVVVPFESQVGKFFVEISLSE